MRLFFKISSFFTDMRFEMFAFNNSEQRQRVSKKAKSLFAVTNSEQRKLLFLEWNLFFVSNSEQRLKVTGSASLCSLLVTADRLFDFFFISSLCLLLVTGNSSKPQLWKKPAYLKNIFKTLSLFEFFIFLFSYLFQNFELNIW